MSLGTGERSPMAAERYPKLSCRESGFLCRLIVEARGLQYFRSATGVLKEWYRLSKAECFAETIVDEDRGEAGRIPKHHGAVGHRLR